MRRVIKASKVQDFMRYHNSASNYYKHPDDFDRVYDILDKYGDENEDVSDLFQKASELDQDLMLALIKPPKKLGERGYSASLYRKALRGDAGSSDYCDGMSDMIHALITEGLLDKNEFSSFEQ